MSATPLSDLLTPSHPLPSVQINGKQEYLGIFPTENEVGLAAPLTLSLSIWELTILRLLWRTISEPWRWVEWIV